MNDKIQIKSDERKSRLEDFILEVLATVFVGSLAFICFWIVFRS